MKKVIFFWCLLLNSINASAQIPTSGLIGYSPFSTNYIRGNNARANEASLATIRPFDSHKERILTRTNAIEKLAIQNRLAANIDVAKTTKYSFWNKANKSWDVAYATDATYANNKLVSELYLSYSLSDTQGKKTYNYDANGRCTLIEYKTYNPTNHTYSESDKTTYSYSTNESYIMLLEFYNTQTNTWTPNFRDTYKFNSHKAQTKFLRESYSNGLWSISQGDSSNIIYYNNTYKIVQDKEFTYNQSANIWEAIYERNSSYNIIGQLVRTDRYNYINNIASLVSTDSIKYDVTGAPISTIDYYGANMEKSWKKENITWEGGFNNNIDYYENLSNSWVESKYEQGNWTIKTRYSVIYPDSFGSRISLYEPYNNNTFRPNWRISNINNFNFHLIGSFSETYDTITSKWKVDYGRNYTYQYDASNRKIECILKQWSNSDTVYVNSDRIEYSNYITILAGVNPNQNTLEVKLYPNPSENGNVKINLNLEKSSNISISVIDINGRKVSSQEVNLGTGLNTVQLSNMNTGLYFIEIISDYGIYKTKLIVK